MHSKKGTKQHAYRHMCDNRNSRPCDNNCTGERQQNPRVALTLLSVLPKWKETGESCFIKHCPPVLLPK